MNLGFESPLEGKARMKIDHGKNAAAIRRLDDLRRSVPAGYIRYRFFVEISDRLRVERVKKMITAPNSKALVLKFQEECKKTKVLSFPSSFSSEVRTNQARHPNDAA